MRLANTRLSWSYIEYRLLSNGIFTMSNVMCFHWLWKYFVTIICYSVVFHYMYLMQKQYTPIAFTEIKRVNSNQVLLIKVHHSTIRRNIHKWKTFNIARKFTPRSEWVMQRENAEHPRATSQTYRLHLECQMLKFMTVPLKNRVWLVWKSCQESLFSIKIT